MRWQIGLFGVLLGGCWLGIHPADAQVREIPRPMMRGVAKTVMRGGTPVIYYNPNAISRMGPAAGQFVRAHEYGHIRLGHLQSNIPRRRMEAEADLYAARVSSPQAVRAAQRWFLAGNGGGWAHGTPWVRAQRLSRGLAFQPRYRVVRRY